MKEKQNPAEPKPAAREEKQAETPRDEKQPPKASGLAYVFKIAPADPKNTFDFEDVADK
jgi:hypothetical protein